MRISYDSEVDALYIRLLVLLRYVIDLSYGRC
jgi:uncharacterized protein YuzE